MLFTAQRIAMIKGVIMREVVRLTGKELFIYYDKTLGVGDNKIVCGGCTNKRVLASRTGIEYSKLMWHFTRKGRCYYDDGEIIILKLYVNNITKGMQSFSRRGRGGMESFVKYLGKGSGY